MTIEQYPDLPKCSSGAVLIALPGHVYYFTTLKKEFLAAVFLKWLFISCSSTHNFSITFPKTFLVTSFACLIYVESCSQYIPLFYVTSLPIQGYSGLPFVMISLKILWPFPGAIKLAQWLVSSQITYLQTHQAKFPPRHKFWLLLQTSRSKNCFKGRKAIEVIFFLLWLGGVNYS